MTPDEVRMLDNEYAILFIRGEKPIIDKKYNTFKHPNFKYTEDGHYKSYLHGKTENAVASISLDTDIENMKDIKEFKIDNIEGYEILIDEEIEEYLLEKNK